MGPTILHTEYILSYFRTKVVEIAQYLWFFTAKPSYATTFQLLVSEYRPIIHHLFKTPMQNFPTQSHVVGTSWTTTFGKRPRPLFGVTCLQCLGLQWSATSCSWHAPSCQFLLKYTHSSLNLASYSILCYVFLIAVDQSRCFGWFYDLISSCTCSAVNASIVFNVLRCFFKLHAFNKLALHDLYIRGIMYYATKSM